LEKPNGLPMAITVSPIIRLLESPIVMSGRAVGEEIRSTARSESESAPTICAVNSRPSLSATVMVLLCKTTCLLVRINPRFPSIMTPDPKLVRLYRRSNPGSKKSLKKFSKEGSMPNPEKGFFRLRTSNSELMLTTTGVTFLTAITTAFSRRFSAPTLSGSLTKNIIKKTRKTNAETNRLFCIFIFVMLHTVIINKPVISKSCRI